MPCLSFVVADADVVVVVLYEASGDGHGDAGCDDDDDRRQKGSRPQLFHRHRCLSHRRRRHLS